MKNIPAALIWALTALTGCKASETLSISSNRIPYTDDALVRLDLANGRSIFATGLRYERESIGQVSAGDSLWFGVVATARSVRGRDDWPVTAFKAYRRFGQALPVRGLSRQDVVAVTYRKVNPARTVGALAVFGLAAAAVFGAYVAARLGSGG